MMGTHKNISVLLVTESHHPEEPLVTYLESTGCKLRTFTPDDITPATVAEGIVEDALTDIDQEGLDILVVEAASQWCTDGEVCKKVRRRFYNRPLQVILLINGKNDLHEIVQYNADDAICKPYDKLEIETRMEAAFIRLEGQRSLAQECDFYRKAVKQEEELTVKILDQHIHLKEAFRSIESINRELTLSNKRLERVAKYDVLSGLLNRASLFGAMDAEIERSIRANTPLTGILFDIDYFKQVNDNYGHLLGDEVIKALGSRLNNTLRKYDIAGRYGGEEFFALLPDTTLDIGITIADRFRIKLKERAIEWDNEEIHITASFGVSQFLAGESRDMWVARTDKAMYLAKEGGRDKVVGI